MSVVGRVETQLNFSYAVKIFGELVTIVTSESTLDSTSVVLYQVENAALLQCASCLGGGPLVGIAGAKQSLKHETRVVLFAGGRAGAAPGDIVGIGEL